KNNADRPVVLRLACKLHPRPGIRCRHQFGHRWCVQVWPEGNRLVQRIAEVLKGATTRGGASGADIEVLDVVGVELSQWYRRVRLCSRGRAIAEFAEDPPGLDQPRAGPGGKLGSDESGVGSETGYGRVFSSPHVGHTAVHRPGTAYRADVHGTQAPGGELCQRAIPDGQKRGGIAEVGEGIDVRDAALA